MAGLNPLTNQGLLNRLITHVTVSGYPNLNIQSSYMGKAMATVTFEGDNVDQIGTATAYVPSPNPYVMAQAVVSTLRTQTLASAWLAQMQTNAQVGDVTIFYDSTTFAPITISNCSLFNVDPGPSDGTNPEMKITLKGIYYVNSVLWAATPGTAIF